MPLTPQITLTATLDDITGQPAGSTANPARLRIVLCGFGLTLPQIVGTATLARIVYDERSTGGQISAALWGNDVITPAGTYYAITVFDGDNNVVQCGAYRFTGTTTVDLSSAPQITPTNSLALSPCSGAVPGTVYTAPGQIILLLYNGIPQRPGVDYTLGAGGNVANLTFTTQAGDSISALCAIVSPNPLVPGAWLLSYQQCTGAVPGTAYVAPAPAVAVALNGILLRPVIDYTIATNLLNITLTAATHAGDQVFALCG